MRIVSLESWSAFVNTRELLLIVKKVLTQKRPFGSFILYLQHQSINSVDSMSHCASYACVRSCDTFTWLLIINYNEQEVTVTCRCGRSKLIKLLFVSSQIPSLQHESHYLLISHSSIHIMNFLFPVPSFPNFYSQLLSLGFAICLCYFYFQMSAYYISY